MEGLLQTNYGLKGSPREGGWVSENTLPLGSSVNRGSQPPIDRRNLFTIFLIKGPFVFFFCNCPGVEGPTGHPRSTLSRR
jgi:hypothetical protein